MAAVNQGGYTPIRKTDLADPSLILLNHSLQYLFSNLSGSTGNPLGAWQNYVISITPSASMTLSGLASPQAVWRVDTDSDTVLLMLDITFAVGGTPGPLFTINLPRAPASTTVNSVLTCAIITSAGTVAGTAIVGTGVIQVTRFDGSAFSAGACELVISGEYRG